MTKMPKAAKFEIRNQKFENNHAGCALIWPFEFRASNFEFCGASRAA